MDFSGTGLTELVMIVLTILGWIGGRLTTAKRLTGLLDEMADNFDGLEEEYTRLSVKHERLIAQHVALAKRTGGAHHRAHHEEDDLPF